MIDILISVEYLDNKLTANINRITAVVIDTNKLTTVGGYDQALELNQGGTNAEYADTLINKYEVRDDAKLALRKLDMFISHYTNGLPHRLYFKSAFEREVLMRTVERLNINMCCINSQVSRCLKTFFECHKAGVCKSNIQANADEYIKVLYNLNNISKIDSLGL